MRMIIVFKITRCVYTLVTNEARKGAVTMGDSVYEKICYWTEQREEQVPLRNLKTGAIGYSFGCTHEGATVQVRLGNGELDSWSRDEFEEKGPVQ
jgi:hypothetical protein